MSNHKNEQGFVPIEIAGIIAVIIIVATVGFLLFNNRNNAASKTDTSDTSQKLTPKQIEATKVVNVPKLSQKGEVSGSFVQNNGVSWATGQKEAYIGVSVSDASKTSKVEFYANNLDKTSLRQTISTPSVGTLFQYNWPLSDVPGGTYHWLAKIYDKNGNVQLARNDLGDSYIDMVVNVSTSAPNTGSVSGTFVQQNNVSWPSSQNEAYIGVSIDNLSQVSKVEWYVGSFAPTNLIATRTGGGVKNLTGPGGLMQHNWPLNNISAGTYRILVKVYDASGAYQIAKNSEGGLYIDMNVKL